MAVLAESPHRSQIPPSGSSQSSPHFRHSSNRVWKWCQLREISTCRLPNCLQIRPFIASGTTNCQYEFISHIPVHRRIWDLKLCIKTYRPTDNLAGPPSVRPSQRPAPPSSPL